jgi:hypothetical protein
VEVVCASRGEAVVVSARVALWEEDSVAAAVVVVALGVVVVADGVDR